MGEAVVGALRVVFGADASDFDKKSNGVEKVLDQLIAKFDDLERKMRAVGAGLTATFTVAFGGIVHAVDNGAGAFESQMKNVEAALKGVSGKQLKELSDQARNLGPAVGKGATDAAGGIEALGLAGLSANQILGGGLKASLDLAAAGMVDVSTSASLVTDVFGQFHKTTADLPEVVGNVVGALDASKFGFADFQLAVAQGGGIAAEAGVSFKDFSTAIAATSSQFSSGADAGTSFKTYIQSLTGKSDEAKAAMKKLGIEFYDANGRMKPLAEQAQILRDKLSNLTDKSKTDALNTIFGADAARTAIGLMNEGRKGFEDLQSTIENGDVGGKIAKRMEGDAAAGQRIANAWESVKIAIGETGLLDIITAVKNGFARMLEAVAHAPPALLKVAAVFAGLASLLGPLVFLLGSIGTIIAVRFAKGFGLIGRAISFVFAPLETLISMAIEFGSMRALTAGLGMVARSFLGLAGPIGWAVGALIMFKDYVVVALTQVWKSAQETLGPPLQRLFATMQSVWSAMSSGPLGSFVSAIVTAFGVIKDVIGVALAAVLEIAGQVIIKAIQSMIVVWQAFASAVKGVVDIVSSLLRGDLAGAWRGLGEIVDAVVNGIIDLFAVFLPGVEGPLRAAYAAAKAWLADGWAKVSGWVSGAVQSMVNYVAKAFPNVVAAAKSVYNGVKTWLVDKFGWILDKIGKAVKWISDKYASLKKLLGFGDSGAADTTPPPATNDAPPTPKEGKVNVDFDKPDKEKKGRDTKYDEANRAELELQAQLEAARLRGDEEMVRSIEDRLALEKQIEAYQRTGLSLAEATAAAQRDMKLLGDARAQQTAKEIADDQRSFDIKIAEIQGDGRLAEILKKQEYLQDRIAYWRTRSKDLAEATARATADQVRLEGALADKRRRAAEDDARQREIELARLRGDSEASIRRKEREDWIQKRAREIEEKQDLDRGEGDAAARAEDLENEKARITGVWRNTLKDGFRAAMDGDLKGFVKDWWKEQISKGMEEALNKLSDWLQKIFADLTKDSGGGSGGGGLGGIFGKIGKLFGGGGGGSFAGLSTSDFSGGFNFDPTMSGDAFGDGSQFGGDFDFSGVPAAAKGGSFKVGGMSGIDRNLAMMRLTKGELVKVTPANDRGTEGGMKLTMHNDFRGADAAAVSGINAKLDQLEASMTNRILGTVNDGIKRGTVRRA